MLTSFFFSVCLLVPSFPCLFPSINVLFKLVLYATLVFFSYGSQLQIGTALLLCVGRLALHAQFEPYRNADDNVFDYVTLIITALFGLGGIMLQSMETFKNFAIYKGDKRGEVASKSAISVVGLVLNIMVVTVAVIFAVFSLHSLWLKRRRISTALQEVMASVVKRCPCFLRCARRCCPACCCSSVRRRKHVRATTSPSSPPTSPATPSAVEMTAVEMTPQETTERTNDNARGSSFSVWGSLQSAATSGTSNGDIEVGNEGGLVHTNPLYPHFEPVDQGRATTASTRTMSQVARDEASDGSTRHQMGEGRARRDTINPAFSDSKEMVDLNSRDSRQMALKKKMNRRSGSIEL